MSLKIIGTGLGRTGTHSLKLALEELGFSKCYHMENLMEQPDDIYYWEDARAGKPVDWDTLFTGYQAAVDIPAFIYHKELLQKYPDAKMIHTTRDPESWYKSFGDTIIRATRPSFGRILGMMVRMPFSPKLRGQLRVFKFAGKFMKTLFPAGFDNKEKTIAAFHEWNRNVLASIPKEKILVFDARQGWEPLCRFLNVPVPDKPFPHSNTTVDFNSRKI
ncbi:MAG: sulfotransferase family protein [Chitinophagaceae bacterium]|nr:sulfotransferase family protein [Chitinophagaceae bacterium]